ncbi:MAG: hypothetical protein FGM57_02470 [Candidatus Taylorbacteria bacterium]|nr:hypothetical protein [Candidatus Taylorbacteria bacterium]
MESVVTLIHKINEVILNPLITLLFAAAVLVFLYGVFEYVKGADSDDARSTGRNHIIWGVVGMFIMVSAFGIMDLIMNTIGANRSDNGVDQVIR